MAFSGVAVSTSRVLTADAYLDLYAGRWIASHGVPHHDPFTVEGQGRVWIDQQWLAHLAYYGAWRAGGYPLVGAVSALLVAAAVGVTAFVVVRRTSSPGIAIAVMLPAYALILTHTQIWAESFAIPLFALLVALLLDTEGMERHRAARTAAVLGLLVLWANLHGTVLLGVVITAGFIIVRLLQRRGTAGDLVLLVLAPLTLFATPYGFGILSYYRSVLGNSAIKQHVAIWQPWSLDSFFSIEFAIALLLAAVAVAWATRAGYRPDVAVAGLALATAIAGFTAIRYQLWFAIPGAILAGDALGHTHGQVQTLFARRVRTLVACAGGALALISGIVLAATSDATFERAVPQSAVGALTRATTVTPERRVLGDFVVGPAVLWREPELIGRVGLDTRLEIYTTAQLERWFTFNDGKPGWERATIGYAVLAVDPIRHPEIAEEIRRSGRWQVCSSTEDGLVAALATAPSTCG